MKLPISVLKGKRAINKPPTTLNNIVVFFLWMKMVCTYFVFLDKIGWYTTFFGWEIIERKNMKKKI